MNIYIVVEGDVGEKELYKHWIPYINNQLTYSATLSEVSNNNFYITSGGGYPNIFEIIEDGIKDMYQLTDNTGNRLFQRFVVVIDSENCSFKQRYTELENFILSKLNARSTIDFKIIIQHFCMETWALANRKIVSNNIHSPELLKYKNLFNVAINDPEQLPDLVDEELNRSQFAAKYLRLLLNNKFRNTSYSKSSPKSLLPKTYFDQVVKRHQETSHISSFSSFLSSFV